MAGLNFIEQNILNSYLISFGIKAQFIELEFDNENFEK